MNTQNIMIKESEHVTIKSYQITKDNSKTGRKEQRIYKTENNDQNDNSKSLPITSYFKCKHKFSNQTQRMGE